MPAAPVTQSTEPTTLVRSGTPQIAPVRPTLEQTRLPGERAKSRTHEPIVKASAIAAVAKFSEIEAENSAIEPTNNP